MGDACAYCWNSTKAFPSNVVKVSDIADLRPGTYDSATYSVNVVAAAPRLEPKAAWGGIDGSAWRLRAVSTCRSEEAEPRRGNSETERGTKE